MGNKIDKFKNKYRIPSARLQTWDYGSNGAYFITICTHHREPFFGDIITAHDSGVPTMQLNEMGVLAEKYWMEIPQHFPFIELGNFVVMPNHTHGILIIDKNDSVDGVSHVGDVSHVETLQCNVSTQRHATTNAKTNKWQKISPKSGTISTVVRSYKSVVSKHARKIHADFAWQSRFHDHIIRDAQSFETIQHYIINNPSKWTEDKFNG